MLNYDIIKNRVSNVNKIGRANIFRLKKILGEYEDNLVKLQKISYLGYMTENCLKICCTTLEKVPEGTKLQLTKNVNHVTNIMLKDLADSYLFEGIIRYLVNEENIEEEFVEAFALIILDSIGEYIKPDIEKYVKKVTADWMKYQEKLVAN